jgi:hypothetical protein|tara:strand:- start:300 stop:794 length:495 start_codon:yes stop_codon:yes gene_type:complete
MKTNIALFGLLIVFLSSCSSPRYLPSSDKIDVNEYGSYLKLHHKTASNIVGELIAIDSNKIIVLTEETKTCMTVPVNEVKKFKLWYAKPKHYGWTIPVYTLATISHGWWLIFSAPVNLIVTISVTASGESAFTYSSKDMTYDKLKMFARFPQGIPPDIDLASIK